MREDVDVRHWVNEDKDSAQLYGHPGAQGIVLGHFVILHDRSSLTKRPTIKCGELIYSRGQCLSPHRPKPSFVSVFLTHEPLTSLIRSTYTCD